MDRIAEIFAQCKTEHRAALIIFVSVGYPTLRESLDAAETALANGADIIELGIPFSDPMADGPVICDASRIALGHGTVPADAFDIARTLRVRHPRAGLVLFSYLNPIFRMGYAEFCRRAAAAGADGVLAVDLPLEESAELDEPCRNAGLRLIRLIAPTTPPERIRKIAAAAAGFLYAVNVCGTTGGHAGLPPETAAYLERATALSPVPVAAGFGISDAATARTAARHAAGIVVGSAFLQAAAQGIAYAGRFVRELRAAAQRE